MEGGDQGDPNYFVYISSSCVEMSFHKFSFLGSFKFQKLSFGFETSDMTSEGLGEMFEGDSANTCGGKFPFMYCVLVGFFGINIYKV